jgi:hypothetical protein
MKYETIVSVISRVVLDGYDYSSAVGCSPEDYGQVYSGLEGRVADSYNQSRDILLRYVNGYISRSDALNRLQDEAGMSYSDVLAKLRSVEAVRRGVQSRGGKRSRYHGALVNDTFADGTVSAPVHSGLMGWGDVQCHPSSRFLVLSRLVPESLYCKIRSSVSGSLDSRLFDVYASSGGDSPNVSNSGKGGRVEIRVDSEVGVTEVDLGGSLESGYVISYLQDDLGLFPDGIVDGDLLSNEDVDRVVVLLGEMDGHGEEYPGLMSSGGGEGHSDF